MTPFERLPDLILAPLAGRPDADWYQAPPGKWCAAQIVHHLAIGIESSGLAFESRADKPPMIRRQRSVFMLVANLLIMRIGWFPPGRKSPAQALPSGRPERAAVERQLADGARRFVEVRSRLIPSRSHDLFVRHPVLGDLTIGEWTEFHSRHVAHHVRQIHARLAGL